MKFEGTMTIQLAKVVLSESIAACGYAGDVFDTRKTPQIKMTDIGRGILMEATGFPDVLVYPSVIKTAVALTDLELLNPKPEEPKVEPKIPVPPIENKIPFVRQRFGKKIK
jgi:hypothetical protein